ncbi:molybdate ABC transporter substrate-binding protein [Paraneptunicella aestuarii]|nr:molybdate ABC transporter substrate-binding protein [Paraneptunicella aestuarii]
MQRLLSNLFLILLLTYSGTLFAGITKVNEPALNQEVNQENKNNNIIRIAVAANFKPTLEKLIAVYKQKHPNLDFKVSSASTGVLYSQILNGAPFDLFFSADWQHPDKLIKKGIGHKHRSAVYAIGQLVLWYPKMNQEDSQKTDFKSVMEQLAKTPQVKIAMANPDLAPFGKAAQQALQRTGFSSLNEQIVKGNNVAQAYQFVYAGAANAGFVSLSQIDAAAHSSQIIMIPDDLYSPIKQQMLVIQPQEAAMGFYRFVLGITGREIIAQNGYAAPSSADVKLML